MNIPEKGFYYHFKHDPSGEINNYAYEVVGIGLHTEQENQVVLYRPLYKSDYIGNADCFARPIDMFVDVVERNSKKMPRFTKITDSEVLARLEQIRDEKYIK